jgi:hypothetical protein
MLHLKDAPVLAMGLVRKIYQHPGNDDWLIKVVRTDTAEVNDPPWHKSGGRHGIYVDLVREIDEYIAIRSRHDGPLPCIQQVHGLAETDQGLGLVVEKLRGPDGRLAPTIHAVVSRDGFTPELRRAFEDYLVMFNRLNIVATNFGPQNVVYAASAQHGNRLVLVDGLGEKTWLPLNSYVPLVNRMGNRRRWQRTFDELERIDAALRAAS